MFKPNHYRYQFECGCREIYGVCDRAQFVGMLEKVVPALEFVQVIKNDKYSQLFVCVSVIQCSIYDNN